MGRFDGADRQSNEAITLSGAISVGTRALHLLCPRPIHHVLELSRLFEICEDLKNHGPEKLRLHLWLRSALHGAPGFGALPGELHVLPENADAQNLRRTLRKLGNRRERCIVAGSREELEAGFAEALHVVEEIPFDFRGPFSRSERAAAACDRFFDALSAASPRWLSKPSDRNDRSQPPRRFLVHQSRFRLGDSLWLTHGDSDLRSPPPAELESLGTHVFGTPS